MLIGQSIWFMLLAYVCSFLGALQVPAFIGALIYSAAGFVYNWNYVEDGDDSSIETKNISIVEKCAHFWDSPILKSTPHRQQIPVATTQPSGIQSVSSPVTSNVDDPATVLKNKLELNLKAQTQSTDDNNHMTKSQSAIYFKVLFLTCLVTILYQQLFVLALCFIPILVYIANNAIITFGIKECLQNQLNELFALMQVRRKIKNVVLSNVFHNFCFRFHIQDWILARQSALLPLCLPGLMKLNTKVHKYVRITLKDSIDTASSILVIVLLIFVVIFASVFCAVEIYSETITVVQLGSDVVNYTINHRPELMDMFPEGK